ncbi:LacI family DNA-binding transcriptional regulator [Cellulophaga fucicola]|uniref:LacI family DNA-binding transcriptional regulator n=1 Tax=Cellulophaga fucicola TaxID=76595 RepID=UPI003EBBD7FA
MKAKITIKDIAKELGVSSSTVSRALKNSPEISEETRKKVKAFADLYHYRPNMLAQKLRNNKTMVIGVIIPEIVHHFFSRVISGVEKIANGRDYNVMICLSNESYEKEKLNIQMMANGSVDGLLVSIAKETLEKGDFDHFKELKDYSIPLVLFDRISDKIDCDKVIVDDIGGGYKATKHLLDVGCKKIAILSTPDHVNVGALRTIGYKKALEESNIKVNNDLIFKVNDKSNITEQITTFMHNTTIEYDGIVAVNEIYAANVIKIAKEKDLQIPKDLCVVGFTDGLISSFSTPSLSTIDQHGITIGEHAAELLLDRIQNKEVHREYQRKVVSTDLIIRKSSEKNTDL